MKNIATALLSAKRAFGPALKEKTNPAFRSKYADLGSCLDAVDQPCLDAGIILYQETFEDMTGVTVETVFLHESGESLRCGKLHVPASKQDPQGYGSALTYARRYSLITACGIAPEDDDGNAAKPPVATYLSKTQCETISSLANEVNAEFPALLEWVSKAMNDKYASLSSVPASAFNPIMKKLQQKKDSK